MYSKKQHIARKTIITCLAFAGGMISTVLAAAVYDANVQSRANTIFDVIKNNASTMDQSDSTAYYNLVRLNIKSLVEVLTAVDGKILTEIGSTLPGLDDIDIIGELTGTGNIGSGNADPQCTMQYDPVCGEVSVQCITAPCPPIRQTFSNSCVANSKNAKNIVKGACESGSNSPNNSNPTIPPSSELPAASCQKNITIGNLNVCDTGKKSKFTTKSVMNAFCPTGMHTPNYWEMQYLVESGVKLDLDKNSTYYIDSLYGEIVQSPGYPFNGYPYKSTSQGQMNHISDFGYELTVFCINNSGLPTVSMNGVKSCKITKELLETGLSGQYSKQDITRENLIEGENITLESNQISLSKGNLDFTLNLSCKGGSISKTESIKKINNCAYGYTNMNNDCKVDPLVCNTENLGNVHPSNSKVCSWKELAKKEYFIYDHNGVLQKTFRWNSISDNDELEKIKRDWENITKKELLEQYRSYYNHKIDINLDCNVKKEGEYDIKFSYVCNVNGLFWQ